MLVPLTGALVKFRGQPARVERHEPHESAMTDLLLKFDDGKELWVASHEVTRPDGTRLPARRAYREQREDEVLHQLKAIREKPDDSDWRGAEFGRAMLRKGLDQSIAELEAKRAARSKRE